MNILLFDETWDDKIRKCLLYDYGQSQYFIRWTTLLDMDESTDGGSRGKIGHLFLFQLDFGYAIISLNSPWSWVYAIIYFKPDRFREEFLITATNGICM